MSTIEVNGKSFEVDEEGYLANLNEWEPAIGEAMAAAEDQPLTQEHWDIINLTRKAFYDLNQVAEPRKFMKMMKAEFGKDRSTNKYIFTLFPKGGLIKSANKVAGLPRPKGCS